MQTLQGDLAACNGALDSAASHGSQEALQVELEALRGRTAAEGDKLSQLLDRRTAVEDGNQRVADRLQAMQQAMQAQQDDLSQQVHSRAVDRCA